jgi:hypothetical protein
MGASGPRRVDAGGQKLIAAALGIWDTIWYSRCRWQIQEGSISVGYKSRD